MILLALSALCVSLTGPPLNLWFMGTVSLFALFRLIDRGPYSGKRALAWGAWFGLCQAVLVTPYMWGVLLHFSQLPVIVAAAVFLAYGVLSGTPMMLFFLLLRWTRGRVPELVAWPTCWLLADLLGWKLFYWNLVTMHTGDLLLVQLVDVLGLRGLNVVLFLIALCLYRRRWRPLALVLLAILHLYGLWAFRAWQPAGHEVLVGVAQGNTPAGEHGPRAGHKNVANMANLSRALLRQGPVDLLVWPEGAVWPAVAYAEDGYWQLRVRTLLAQFPPFELMLCQTPDRTNQILLLSSLGIPLGTYQKMTLVPFSEYTPGPFKWIAPSRYDFRHGTRRELLPSSKARILPLICYEILTPGRFEGAVTEADMIVNPTSDTWFHSSLEARQHFYAMRVRAIETRLPVVRAANSGVSALVDRLGRVHGATAVDEAAMPIYPVLCGDGRTSFYARYGDIPFLLLWLGCLLAIRLPRRKVTSARDGSAQDRLGNTERAHQR